MDVHVLVCISIAKNHSSESQNTKTDTLTDMILPCPAASMIGKCPVTNITIVNWVYIYHTWP